MNRSESEHRSNLESAVVVSLTEEREKLHLS